MGRAKLSKSLIQFAVNGPAMFPPWWLAWGQTMVGVMVVMVTSFRRINALTVVLSATDPVASHFWPMPPQETPGHAQASPAQSLVGTLLLFSRSWCAQGFVCALQESVSPVQWKFCNQIPFIGLQSPIPWGFSVPLLDPHVEKSVLHPRTFLTVWEFLWYNCSIVCGSSAQWLYSGANGDLLQER